MTEENAKKTEGKTLAQRISEIPYWYHKIELPGGVVTPGWSPIDAGKYSIPDDLTGKRVLDVGAWDGYWTFEALKRGAAEVVAIDDFSDDLGSLKEGQRNKWGTFDLCRQALGFNEMESRQCYRNAAGQRCGRIEMSVYKITEKLLGRFDVIFFFGTLYHLRYPLLALDVLSKISDGSIYIETAQADDYSAYKGGIGKGYANNDMVMEFYPGKQYGNNDKNWWAPTLQCLCEMVKSAGWQDVDAWPLTDDPKGLGECRGFVSATKDAAKEPANRPEDLEPVQPIAKAKVGALMSVPRLGFHDNMSCVFEAFAPLQIPMLKVQGAFWGQCLERGMQLLIDDGTDLIVTVDYDTTFKKADVITLLDLMHKHPEAAAIAATQIGRGHYRMLLTVKGKSGQVRSEIPLKEFQENETTKIASSHFGLTVLRVSDLMDIPHPWFLARPNSDGQWAPGRIDADIAFWKLLEKHKKTVLSANRVVVGHLELMTTWPSEDGKPIYQLPEKNHKEGKPKGVWK